MLLQALVPVAVLVVLVAMVKLDIYCALVLGAAVVVWVSCDWG
jgi:hypothetical protein